MKTRLLTFFPENQQPRQFTPLREGRLLDFLHRRVSVDISIHAPPRGATRGIGDINTTCNISIHAPPRGATVLAREIICAEDISIHAPPRGATRSRASASSSFRFQFTPLREGRQGRHGDGARRHDISIHAPPRGATVSDDAMGGTARISIHAPPRGATSDTAQEAGTTVISIHAPPRGATPICYTVADFCRISIHAPPRGATPPRACHVVRHTISIHAPPRGATLSSVSAANILAHFNSRPSARGDIHEKFLGSEASKFQFTPLREGRRDGGRHLRRSGRFQFTPLREGRLPRWK